MLEVNLKNRAITQHTRTFNSMCKFGNTYLGASAGGLFQIGGYNDAGVQIPALIRSGTFDLGTNAEKRFRFLYFGLKSNGTLTISLYHRDTLATKIAVPSTGGLTKEIRVPVSRQYQGGYWFWQIENKDGAFFALYSVKGLPIIMHPGRRA